MTTTDRATPIIPDDALAPSRRPTAARIAGYALGLILVGLAIWFAARSAPPVGQTLASIRGGGGWYLGALLASILATFGLIAAAFGVLTARYGRIGAGEMMALIFGAGLLNYLPMWPGMFGRLAYHKKINGIEIRQSAAALIWANVIGLAGAPVMLGLVALGAAIEFTGWAMVALCAAPCIAAGALAPLVRRAAPEPDPEVWRLFAASSIRYAELLVWALRFWLCFALVGAPISAGAALAVSGVAKLAVFIPIAPNALGIREWAVGFAAPLLPLAFSGAALDTPTALAADLLNRAMEIALLIPAGILSSIWVARRMRRAGEPAEA